MGLGLPGGSEIKPLPAVRETWVWSLGQEDPLEKEMATHSSTLTWKIPWATIHGVAQSVGHDWATSLSLSYLSYLLMKVKEESEKAGLKLYIQKMKIMASSPIASWQIDGETMETVTDFLLLGSKITADGDCSHEIKRRLVLGRKATTNLDSVF